MSNQLTALPESIGQLTTLTSFNLMSNQLTALPESIGQLTSLTLLNLTDNQLTVLSESIGELTSLTSLYLMRNKLTTLPESIGELTSLTALYLMRNKLTTLPESIGEVTSLGLLDLRDNQLTALPGSIGQLTGLTSLYLTGNYLTALPESIGQLTSLTSLDLSDNSLTALPESVGQLTGLMSLHLIRNQPKALPESIGQLASLTSLDLMSNQLTALPESIGQLTNLTSLDVRNNQLRALPESIGQLTGLRSLDLRNNQLTALPESIGQLNGLTSLYLRNNQLTALPESIGQLTGLTSLDLRNNQLTALPESIGQLTGLTSLDLRDNQLTALPESIGKLTGLTSLDLTDHRLRTLPESIGELTRLALLDLRDNQLTALPESIGQLTSLTSLDLSDNLLTALPESIGQPTRLASLDLSDNQLTELAESIGQLTSLTSLDLSDNLLTALPESIGQLTSLMSLDLSGNQLTVLPESMAKLTALHRLFLHGNAALGLPPEVLGPTNDDGDRRRASPEDPARILDYYFRVRRGRRPLNEAKLILLGHGNVGKTSLVNRLVHGTFDKDEKKTEGIKITQWPIRLHDTEDVRLHIWDFGGQEIMHATHQFFLTQRSVYLLVLNGRQGHEDADADYWLSLVKSFGEDSPVIVVLNKIKEQPFDLNRGALTQKFPAVRAFITTDCEDGTGIDDLRAAIERETDRLDHLRDAFPSNWFSIKDRLAGMQDNYLTLDRFREICREHGEADLEAQDSLVIYLRDLGIALNYKDDPRLRDTHVLNPHWVTSGIYAILNSEAVARQEGELRVADLATILDPGQYPRERHGFLLELMRKFELCFGFPEDEGRYLIPELLDKQQPAQAEDFKSEECLNFQYQYPVLPEGLLPRFIVRTYVLSRSRPRWRTGVILAFEDTSALVKADAQDKRVHIAVAGPASRRRELLAIIRSDLEHIHSSFAFEPREMVPLAGHPDALVPYEDLLVREKAGQREYSEVVAGGLVVVNVEDALNGVDLQGTRRPARPTEAASPALRLFYSYSHRDEELRDELEKQLTLLKRQGLIQPWHDRRITAGKEWKGEIDAHLEQADIVLLLVSADFLASDYCYDVEWKRAKARHDAAQARVVPIIVRDVSWHSAPFAKLQALPTDGKAVTTWDNRDTAWRNVAEGIEEVVVELRTTHR